MAPATSTATIPRHGPPPSTRCAASPTATRRHAPPPCKPQRDSHGSPSPTTCLSTCKQAVPGYSIPPVAKATPDPQLVEQVASVRWYHSLELPGGIETPGNFDTLGERDKLPFPTSLLGLRCLDVATSDGFWAFEMERRGAAEVVAVDVYPSDLDWPGRRGR